MKYSTKSYISSINIWEVFQWKMLMKKTIKGHKKIVYDIL